MELTLAEEIRALLKMHDEESPQPRGKCFMQFWCAFPALAAKMLAVIAERDLLQVSIEALPGYVVRINELEAQREQLLKEKNRAPGSAAARISELKEDAVRWETRYKFAMEQFTEERNYHIHTLKEMQAAQKERDRLRFEAGLLKEQPGC